MNRRTQSKPCLRVMMDITSLAMSTPSHVADVFVEWAAHVGTLYVRVFRGGWSGRHEKPDWQAEKYFGDGTEAGDYADLLELHLQLKAAIKGESK